MKCQACGFDNSEKATEKFWANNEFVEIDGHFTTVKSAGDYYEHISEITVYACPMCGTLKVNPDDL